jgi:hypothetical protein
VTAQITIRGSSEEPSTEVSHGPRSGLAQNSRRKGPGGGLSGIGSGGRRTLGKAPPILPAPPGLAGRAPTPRKRSFTTRSPPAG